MSQPEGARDNLRLRPANADDIELVRELYDDAQTINSILVDMDEAEFEDAHREWFEDLVSDPDRELFIVEEDGVPVGTVGAERVEGATELSWTVAPASRGHGVGRRMVRQLARQIGGPLIARIPLDDLASIRIAETAGLRRSKVEQGAVLYRRG